MVSTQVDGRKRRGGVSKRRERGGIPLDRVDVVPKAVLPLGTSRCQCNRCGLVFSTVNAFDGHQTLNADGTVQCWEPASIGLVERVFVSKNKTVDIPDQAIWGHPGDPDVIAMFQERRAAA